MAYIDKYGVEFSDDKKTLVRCPEDFEGKYVIPEGVIIIGYRAFCGCTKMTNVIIPSSVRTIEIEAFWDCPCLTDIVIPDSVTNTLHGIFCACINLKSVIIGNNVTSIGSHAFADCSNLIKVILGNKVEVIDDIAFANCHSLTSITIPKSVTSIGDNAFRNCSSLVNITIGNCVTSIGDWAFADCINLVSISIPDSVTSIGEGTFGYCENLKSITIGKGLTRFGESYSGKPFLLAVCDAIIRAAESNVLDIKNFKSPIHCEVDFASKKVSYTLLDPNIEVLQVIEQIYNVFIVDYISRVRTYIKQNEITSKQQEDIEKYLNTCLKKKNIEDFETLTKDCMSVPLPDIAPYQFIEGTHWSYGDLLGVVHMLCLAQTSVEE